tara:strand:+ start:28 stop:2265 length:2238 start_codon:yes stop_codon:yes gene_type:complete
MFDNKWHKKEMPLVSLMGMGGGLTSPGFLSSVVFLGLSKPTILLPENNAGIADFNYTAKTSAVTNVTSIGGGTGAVLTLADNSVSKLSDGSAVDTTMSEALAIGSTIKVPGNSDTANWIATSLLDGYTQGVTSSSQQNMTSQYIAVDSSENIYIAGSCSTTSGTQTVISKYTRAGVLLWCKAFPFDQGAKGMGIDSAGNIYICSHSNKRTHNASAEAGTYGVVVAKFNTNGYLQWQRVWIGPTSSNFGSSERATSMHVDPTGNVYVCGYNSGRLTPYEATGNAIYAKWDTNGTLQWQRQYGDTGYNSTTKKNDEEQAKDIIIDSAGNVIVVGICKDIPPAGKYHDSNGFVLKCDSYGVPVWQRVISGTGHSGSSAGTEQANGVAVDSSDNIYVLARSNSSGLTSGNYDFVLMKYDSSGSLQWQKKIGGSSSDSGSAIVIDSSDNIYIGGSSSSTADSDKCFIAKFDASGNVVWQNRLGVDRATGSAPGALAGTVSESASDFAIHGSNIYVAGYIYDNGKTYQNQLIAKLPIDGSAHGVFQAPVFGEIRYRSSSISSSTSALTDTAATRSSAALNITEELATFALPVDFNTVLNTNVTLTHETTEIFNPPKAAGEVQVVDDVNNTIRLINLQGIWEVGDIPQSATAILRDYADAVASNSISLSSSEPSAEKDVSTWGDSIWEVATDENFTQNVQTATSALSATGTQTGPNSGFTLNPSTGYYVRTKYSAQNQESEWSDVVYFLTAA